MLPTDPNGYYPGYLLYLAAFFVPGIGFGELLGAWKREDGLGEKLGYAFGIGLAVDTLVLVIKLSGFDIVGYRLAGMDISVVYFLIVLGLAALAISYARKRTVALPSRPTRVEAVLLLAILIQAGLIYLFFTKYPIYPAYPSQDFRNHAAFAQEFISGNLTWLPAGVLYYAADSQIAIALLAVGGFAMSTAERTMALLAILSPLIVFLTASKLFSSRGAALVAAVLYSLSGTIWYVTVFDAGLDTNFFGILASLFMLTVYIDAIHRGPRFSKWSLFGLGLVMFYMSHYSDLSLLPAFLAIPIYQLARNRDQLKPYLVPTALVLAPAAAAAAVLPRLYPYIIGLVEVGKGNFVSQSFISGVLSGVPVLSYLAGEINNDLGFLVLVFLFAVYVVRFRSGSSLLLFPIVWFVALLLVPSNLNTWRFAFVAVVPLLLMAGFALDSLVSFERKPGRKRIQTNISRRWKAIIIVGLIVTPIILGSWTTEIVGDTTTDTSLVNESQYAVYNATLWMAQKTSPNATFLALTDWHFSYSNSTIGRDTVLRFFSHQQHAIAYANEVGASYIIVTYVVTIPLPATPGIYPWNNFKPTSNLTLAYSNADVEIFKII